MTIDNRQALPRPLFLNSAFRYVLTYSWVWFCAATVVAANVAVMLTRGAPWRGDLIWTIDWLPIAFVLTGPLVAGFVAVDTSRLAVGVRGLALSPRRTFDLAVGVTYALVLGILQLLIVGTALLISRPALVDWGAFAAILSQITMVMLFVAIGSLVGRFAPVILGGIGAALAALAAVYLLSEPGSSIGLLDAGAATTPRTGSLYSVPWLLFQFLALACAVLAIGCVRHRGSQSFRRLGARSTFGATMAVCAVVSLAVAPGSRLEANRGVSQEDCGALATVPFCYYPQHERVIGYYADNLMALFEAAHDQGYTELVPTRVAEADQQHWTGDATTGAFYVTPEALTGQRPELWETAMDLVQPVHCPQLNQEAPPGEQYWKDLDALTATWVGLVDPSLLEQHGYLGDMLSPAEGTELIRQFRTCTYPFE